MFAEERRAELVCAFSAMILSDEGQPITSQAIQTIADSAGLKIDKCWTLLFAEAVKDKDLMEFIGLAGVNLTHLKTEKELRDQLIAEEVAIEQKLKKHQQDARDCLIKREKAAREQQKRIAATQRARQEAAKKREQERQRIAQGLQPPPPPNEFEGLFQ